MIVIDNSISMSFLTANGNVRKTETLTAVKELVNSIYNENSSVKVGLVRFAGKTKAGNYRCSENVKEGYCQGGESFYYPGNDVAAQLMQSLTQNKSDILNSIYDLENLDTPYKYGTESSTDIASGVELAYNSFSQTTNNKTIILVTDGVPTEYFGTTYTSLQYGKTNSYLKTIAANTNLITVLTGITDEDSVDESDVISTFGTEENPVADKYYNISDTDLSKTITEDVLKDVKEYIQPNMSSITITDYFPSDITNNFEFSYVAKTSTGVISEKIEDDNTITYTLDELKGNESIKISYQLKLKNMDNPQLLNKVISTNEKVVLKYTDSNVVDHEVILESSPSIKLVKLQSVEETVANPPTGLYASVGVLVVAIIVGSILTISKKKNYFTKI